VSQLTVNVIAEECNALLLQGRHTTIITWQHLYAFPLAGVHSLSSRASFYVWKLEAAIWCCNEDINGIS